MDEYVSDREFNTRILDAADDLLTDVYSIQDGVYAGGEYVAVQTSRLEELRAAVNAKFDATGR